MSSTPFPKASNPLPLVLLLCGFGFVDLVTPPLIEHAGPRDPEIAFLLMGTLFAQAGFLAVWAALGPYSLRIRWALVLLISAALYWIFLVGLVATDILPPSELGDFAAGFLLLPLGFLALQSPIWLFRFASGWRLGLIGDWGRPSPTGARQFGLLHIMLATVAVAVALASLRLAIMAWDIPEREIRSFWLSLGIGSLVAIVYCAFWTLPCLWTAFASRNPGIGIAVIAGLYVVASILIIVIVSMMRGMRPPADAVASFFLLHFSLAAVLLGSLYLGRLSGWTLLRAGRATGVCEVDISSPIPPIGVSTWSSAMLTREELYARGCVEGLTQVVQQIPPRAAARWPIAWDRSSFDLLALWTLLRWERTFLLIALEDMGVDVWRLTCEVDALLNRRRSEGGIKLAAAGPPPDPTHQFQFYLAPFFGGLMDRIAEQSRALGQPYLGTEHLLLAIVAGADEQLAAVLSRHSVTYDNVKEKVRQLLAAGQPAGEGTDAKYVIPTVVPLPGPARPFGPRGASWDSPAAGVPRRFGMAIVMLMMTMYAVLFAALTLLGTHPVVFVVIAVMVTGVGLGQMLLFGGRYPRAASIWVGACLFPVEVLATVVYLRIAGGPGGNEAMGGVLCTLILSPALGAGFGYVAGGLTAGVFLMLDRLKERRESVDAEEDAPSPDDSSD